MRSLSRVNIGGSAALLLALGAYACSASSGGGNENRSGLSGGASGSGNSSGSSSGGTNSGGSGTGGSNSGGLGNFGGGSGSTVVDTDGCSALSQKPEVITSYEPIALLIMQDRTGTMATGFPSGSAQSWSNSVAALAAFVADPASQGLDVGLGFFPPTNNTPDAACGGCDQLVVPIGPIAQTGPQINGAMNANPPNPLNFTPLQCGLQGMINACKAFMAQRGEKCVTVFVTDGNTMDPAPAGCNFDTNFLLNIVAQGYAEGVATYALGMVPASMAFVNQVAQAGGTGSAFDASQGTTAFIAALNTIRSSVAIATTLDCQWGIPPAPNGQTLDPTKVNLQFTPGGGTAAPILKVGSASDCAAAGGGWYYDQDGGPTQVLVCPETCDVLKQSTDGQVDLLFGCESVVWVK